MYMIRVNILYGVCTVGIVLYTVCIVLYRVVINVSQECDSEIMKSIKSGGV